MSPIMLPKSILLLKMSNQLPYMGKFGVGKMANLTNTKPLANFLPASYSFSECFSYTCSPFANIFNLKLVHISPITNIYLSKISNVQYSIEIMTKYQSKSYISIYSLAGIFQELKILRISKFLFKQIYL